MFDEGTDTSHPDQPSGTGLVVIDNFVLNGIGTLAYTGFTVLPPFAAWMPARVSDEEREAYLAAYRDRLNALERPEPLFVHPWSDYDETQRLKPGVPARSGVQWNPRADQTFEQSAEDFARRAVPVNAPFHT